MEFCFKVHLGITMWFLRQHSSCSHMILILTFLIVLTLIFLSSPPVFQANWISLFLKVIVLSSASGHSRRSFPYSGTILFFFLRELIMFYYFIFWLWWAFVAACGFFLVVLSRSYTFIVVCQILIVLASPIRWASVVAALGSVVGTCRL